MRNACVAEFVLVAFAKARNLTISSFWTSEKYLW